jgi:hypothetical protein
VLESRYVEPLAKKIAMMLHFKVMVDGRDITLCEDRSKDARKVCLHIKQQNSKKHSYPADDI